MSHLRDIHKLRQNRNQNPSYVGYTTSTRFSQPTPYSQSSQQYSSDIYNMNFDKFVQQPHSSRFNETYSKMMSSKEMYSKNKDRNHRRGNSNGIMYEPKRQHETVSPGLSIYNFSMKLTQKPSSVSHVSNPLTSRKQQAPNTDFEMMPETQHSHSNQYSNSISKVQRRVSSNSLHRTNDPLKNMDQISKPVEQMSLAQKVNKSGFKILYPIGKGGFGKVWKVENKKTAQVLAMKEMYKAKIIQKKSINSVMNQRTLLAKLKHPFIINMISAFQDRENLYLIMDYLDGGDLRYHIGRRRRFNQNQTKFFIANMIIGLQYLHKNRIIHRDMKPENMVFDSDGYLRITDMGISRQFRQDNKQDTSGTPGYMSPQVICRSNHSYPADYFAVGVMGYQFMLGRRPYNGRNRKQIRDQIVSKQAAIRKQDLPHKWSIQAADFINKMLQRNPSNRLGYHGIQEIKNHPWFADIDWRRMLKKQIPAPYVPLSIQENYQDYKQQISEDTVDENMQQNLLMLRDKQVQNLFEGYYFHRNDSNRKKHSYGGSNIQRN